MTDGMGWVHSLNYREHKWLEDAMTETPQRHDEMKALLTAAAEDTVGVAYEAAKMPDCDHHWISKHQPDFPQPIYWVMVCSLCGQINAKALGEELAELRATLLSDLAGQLDEGGHRAAAGFVALPEPTEEQQ